MNQESFLHALHKATPLTDKILAVVGGGVGATLTAANLGMVQTGIGIGVGVLTIMVLIPRAILSWRDFASKWKSGESDSGD